MMYEIRFRAMGSHIFAAIDSQEAEAEAALELVPLWFENWEQTFSRFRQDSELNRVNNADAPIQPSNLFWQMLIAANQAYELSAGIVSPIVLSALETAGYDRSFDQLKSSFHLSNHLEDLSIHSSFDQIQLDPQQHSIHLPPGARLDFGGIAKGWAAQAAMQRLAQWGPSLVDAGGDIAISRPPISNPHWPIGVADPFSSPEPLMVLAIEQGALATSGRDYRRWTHQDQPQHHLIDPRTMRPAETDILTVTVIAPDLLIAEMAAKTSLILGKEAGLVWLENHPSLATLIVLEDGRTICVNQFSEFILESP
jgi:thiamine biosynthesis lipoprotein